MKFYDALCPAMQNDRIEVRKSEPYSYCQFVSGRDHTTFGEAHHPFMTGSARLGLLCGHPVPAGRSPGVRQPDGRPLHPGGLEGIYGGPHLAGGGVPHPCDEPQGRGKGVAEIRLNGETVDSIPVQAPGSVSEIEVIMG